MKTRNWLLGGLFVILAALVAFAPIEKKLGGALRFVLLHGAVTWVSFVVFLIFSVAAILYLITGKQWIFEYASRAQAVGTGFWLANFFIWVPLGYLEWNVVAWSGEPKAVAAVWAMLFLAVGFLAAQVTTNKKVLSGVYVLVGAGIWWRYAGVGRVLHPLDPVGSSNSPTIKLFFIVMLITTLLIALVLTKPAPRKK